MKVTEQILTRLVKFCLVLNYIFDSRANSGSGQVHGYKDCPNCLIPDTTMVCGKKVFDF